MANLGVMYLLLFSVGIGIRYLIISNPDARKSLADRIEISTPVSSWKRAVEGASLSLKGIDPYDGDVFHESPIFLMLYKSICQMEESYIHLVFVVCDALAAAFLSLAVYYHFQYIVQREKNTELYPKSVSHILLKEETVRLDPFYVAAAYLFCPFTLMSCCGSSTAVFLNLLIALFMFLATTGNFLLASGVLGLIFVQTFHHVILLAPLSLYAYKRFDIPNSKSHPYRLMMVLLSFVAAAGGLLYMSYMWTGSWNFLTSSFLFTFLVSDLTPNFGVFWYFITEMFEHFRAFFLWTFQLNLFVYTAPFTIRLRKEPMMLMFVNLVLLVLFKPYPCLGDLGLYMALLPVWSHLFRSMKQNFMVGCTIVVCVFLGPILWHLWIYNGSANANFYFGVTLVFNGAQIFLFTDFVSGYIKREFYLENGIKTDKEGKMTRLRLA